MSRSIGDPSMRKSAALGRLRHQLKKKRESLADHFDFKLFIIFHFKEKKNSAFFEVAEVLPVMTNNFEETILQGAKNNNYSEESSRELLNKDVVQFHAPRWQSLRRDVTGCTTNMDYFLWPRKDIDRIECRLFSRWKGDTAPHRLIQSQFEFCHLDYEKQLARLLATRGSNSVIINNPGQSVFLFIDKLHIQTSTNTVTMVKLSNVCIYLPQDQLTHWGMETVDSAINPRLA